MHSNIQMNGNKVYWGKNHPKTQDNKYVLIETSKSKSTLKLVILTDALKEKHGNPSYKTHTKLKVSCDWKGKCGL